MEITQAAQDEPSKEEVADTDKKATEALQEKAAKLEVKLEEKHKEKEEKVAEITADKAANPMDSQFPDIFSKPGQFLPGIFDHQTDKPADFKEDINIEKER